jgi:hypothetical protein
MEEKKKDGRANNGRKVGSKNKFKGVINRQPRLHNSAKKDERDKSSLTTKEFLKVKKNESRPIWEERTQKRRVFGVTENRDIRITKSGKLKAYKKKLTGKKKEVMMSIIYQFNQKPYDFLKSYAFVMRWCVVRYGVIKDDMELGYYFYEGMPFTKQEFEKVCVQLGAVRGVFRRFYSKGYIMPFAIINHSGIVKNTEYFTLTAEFANLIKKIYGILSKASLFTFGTTNGYGKHSPELMEQLLQMNTEIQEILTGLRKQELVTYKNEVPLK